MSHVVIGLDPHKPDLLAGIVRLNRQLNGGQRELLAALDATGSRVLMRCPLDPVPYRHRYRHRLSRAPRQRMSPAIQAEAPLGGGSGSAPAVRRRR